MLRRRANLAAVLSLALCVGTAALWIRSYWYEDQLKHAGADGVVDWLILSDHGVLLFDRFDSPVDYQDGYLEREATRFDEPVKFAFDGARADSVTLGRSRIEGSSGWVSSTHRPTKWSQRHIGLSRRQPASYP